MSASVSDKPKTSYEIMKSSVDKIYKPTDEEIRSINPFFLIRYISNDPNTIYIANALNCTNNVPIEAQYKFVKFSTLDKVAFIAYPKKEKIKHLELIKKHFGVNSNTAKEYLKILPQEEVEKILALY